MLCGALGSPSSVSIVNLGLGVEAKGSEATHGPQGCVVTQAEAGRPALARAPMSMGTHGASASVRFLRHPSSRV